MMKKGVDGYNVDVHGEQLMRDIIKAQLNMLSLEELKKICAGMYSGTNVMTHWSSLTKSLQSASKSHQSTS